MRLKAFLNCPWLQKSFVLGSNFLSYLGIPPLLRLDDLEDEGVLGQDPEHMDDAGHHPGLHRGQALSLYRIICLNICQADNICEKRLLARVQPIA